MRNPYEVLGIPRDSVLRYETAIKANKFLVIVHGGPEDVLRARNLLAAAGSVDVQTHPGAA